MNNLKKIIQALPLTSGVYLMKDKQGKIIYVGKAINIRKRVQSYFRKKEALDLKTARLVEEIVSIDYLDTESEAEALLLEASLIKKHDPRFNIDLRDDKSYPLIEISADPFPSVSLARPRTRKKGVTYYGPYVNPKLVREALNIIRRIFPFCTCKKLPKKACLDYHMGLCEAPCEGKIGKREYAKTIKNIRLILEGKKDVLLRGLEKDMETACQKQHYEQAAKIRDQIRALGALYSGTKDINYYKEAEQLYRACALPRSPQRIEAFDVSNIMGQQAVGSMVSFYAGKPDKRNYRRFRIKTVEGIDDFKMIAEIVRRRYGRLKREGKTFPDLIVIDGGKGQLSAAYRELNALHLEIPLMSLAKREEEVFLPKKRKPIILKKDSLGLNLLQRIRDEAHRFAITYHRKLRKKAFLG
ncbi:UvrB/UvrC motif-containing protein [Candidatus Omnitrophota bacterium]